jgi:hypothetical protein
LTITIMPARIGSGGVGSARRTSMRKGPEAIGSSGGRVSSAPGLDVHPLVDGEVTPEQVAALAEVCVAGRSGRRLEGQMHSVRGAISMLRLSASAGPNLAVQVGERVSRPGGQPPQTNILRLDLPRLPAAWRQGIGGASELARPRPQRQDGQEDLPLQQGLAGPGGGDLPQRCIASISASASGRCASRMSIGDGGSDPQRWRPG